MDGCWRACLPDRCVLGADSGATCDVRAHAHRQRKAGPGFPLCVAKCRVHGCAFTAYPQGWVPHGRTQICSAPSNGSPSPGPLDAGPSLLTAAEDAARGVLWPLTGADAARGVRSTQYRRLERTALLLGLREANSVTLLKTAELLGLSFLALRDRARAFQDATRSAVRGALVLEVLRLARFARHPADTLLRAGHAAGLLKARRWSPPRGPAPGELLALF